MESLEKNDYMEVTARHVITVLYRGKGDYHRPGTGVGSLVMIHFGGGNNKEDTKH